MLTVDEIATVTEIIVLNKQISDLKGIEYFTVLTLLDCYSNNLTLLDVSKNTALTSLYCKNNPLTSLDLNATAVTDLSANTTLKEYAYKTVFDGGKLDLTTLDSLDISKASEWSNAIIEGNVISIIDPTEPVTYTSVQVAS